MKNKHSNCYLCASEKLKVEHSRVRDRPDLKVLSCQQCRLVFLESFDHITEGYYEDSGMFNFAPPNLASLEADEEADITRRAAFLAPLVKGKSYLDFGCGSGLTAKATAKVARTVATVEPNQAMQKYIRESLNLPVYDSIEKVDQKFDFISLFHVLEHLPDPRADLQRLSQWLTPNGELIVEVPNADDALVRHFDLETFKDFTYWSCHLFLFTPNTLNTLVSQAELEVITIEQVQRYPLANHLYWLRHGKPGGHKTWKALSNQALDQNYAATLGKLGMCDTLVARVKRR